MRTDLETILRDLEVIDHKMSKVERHGPDMDPSAIVYDVSHVRTILLGAIIVWIPWSTMEILTDETPFRIQSENLER